jgi:hypothetical protein
MRWQEHVTADGTRQASVLAQHQNLWGISSLQAAGILCLDTPPQGLLEIGVTGNLMFSAKLGQHRL